MVNLKDRNQMVTNQIGSIYLYEEQTESAFKSHTAAYLLLAIL